MSVYGLHRRKATYADMVELVDTLDSGSNGSNTVEVQVLLSAPTYWDVAQFGRALPWGGRGFIAGSSPVIPTRAHMPTIR